MRGTARRIDPVHYMQEGFRSQPPAETDRRRAAAAAAAAVAASRRALFSPRKALCSEINRVGEINGYISDFKADLTRVLCATCQGGDRMAIGDFKSESFAGENARVPTALDPSR